MHHSRTPGGNRLRALREDAEKTQLEVELDAELGMGYLQRVESGKVRHPERDTLERILAALGAGYTDRRDVLEMFGYIVDSPLPTETEIQWAMALCQAELDSAMFPAYLLDCGHRILAWNRGFPHLFPIQPVRQSNQHPSMLRVLFDATWGVTARIANPDEFFPASVRALRCEMQLFQQEAWYDAIIQTARTYPMFEYYWQRTRPIYHFAARPLTLLEMNLADAGLVKFRILAEPFAQDRRFRILYCIPADAATMPICLGWFQAVTLERSVTP